MSTLIWLIVVATSIWVLIDAKTIGVKKGQIEGVGNMGPWGWFFVCLLLWIIGFPFYLAKRSEFKRANDNCEYPESDDSGRNLRESPMEPAAGHIYCEACGAELKGGVRFCAKCGAAQSAEIPTVQRTILASSPMQIEATERVSIHHAVKKRRGLSGWMMAFIIGVVLLISLTAIFALIAIAQYKGYVIRSQVSEGSSLADGVKTAVAEYAFNNHAFPAENTVAGLAAPTSISGKYVGSVEVNSDGMIIVRYSSAAPHMADSKISDKILAFKAEIRADSIVWKCDSSAGTTIENKYRPDACLDNVSASEGSADSTETVAPQSAAEVPAEKAGITVVSVDLGSDVGADNAITAPTTSFDPMDTIHASVATDGSGGMLRARWTYQDGQVVDTQDKEVAAGPQITDFSISKPDGWPLGRYHLEIARDGRPAVSRDFAVIHTEENIDAEKLVSDVSDESGYGDSGKENCLQNLPAIKGMSYGDARRKLLNAGYRPIPNDDPDATGLDDHRALGYIEVQSCSAGGRYLCLSHFQVDGRRLIPVVFSGEYIAPETPADMVVEGYGNEVCKTET